MVDSPDTRQREPDVKRDNHPAGELRYGESNGKTVLQLCADGEVVDQYAMYPPLATLRAAQREHAPRLDLYDAGLHCPSCQRVISESTRFAAANNTIYCKACADIQGATSPAGSDLSETNDPTKTVLGESELYHKRLIDYNANIGTGCSHGCSFCYVPSTPQIRTQQGRLNEAADVEDSFEEWGNYMLYRDDAPERLRRQLRSKAPFDNWQRTEEGQGIVGLSFHTDCYQSPRAADITRSCVRELIHHDRHVRILTRSPNVTRDADLYAAHSDQVTVGMSIPSLNDGELRAIETNAPPPTARYEALQEIADAGCRTYISMGPTLPTQDKHDLRLLLRKLADLNPDVIFHEPLNPRGKNFNRTVEAARKNDQPELAEAIEPLSDKETWRDYAIRHLQWVHELSNELSVPVYCWPTGELTSGRYSEYAEWWRSQESPEPFAGREPEWQTTPPLPDCAPGYKSTISDFGGGVSP
jgi:DNA repair photolyase